MKTEAFLKKEVDIVLAALTPTNRRVMQVALHTGLRVGDVLALKTADLKPHFWVTEAKTGKRRQIGLPEPLLSDLRANAGVEWVFEGRSPEKHHTRQAVWKDVKRAAKAFRLHANIAPHSARKTFAAELLSRYGDIEKVRRALNHSSYAVTMIYAMADQQRRAKEKHRDKQPRRIRG